MKRLSVKQIKVASLIQKDIKIVKSPFEKTGKLCGLTGKEVMKIIKELLNKGYIRKFGAILHHQKAGYKKNALVVWSVPSKQIQTTGNIFASFPFISHCYERKPAFRNKYNIFTMIHSNNENISSLINEITITAGINDYMILESVKEYKKTSPEYFK